jgi:hypothetical protein
MELKKSQIRVTPTKAKELLKHVEETVATFLEDEEQVEAEELPTCDYLDQPLTLSKTIFACLKKTHHRAGNAS